MKLIYTTPGGLRRLHRRLEEVRRAYFEVCASNEEAAGSGDSSVWHDNFAYEENQRQMHQLAKRVRELETLIGRAQLVPVPRMPAERVGIGSLVRVQFEDGRAPKELFISGYGDGDPSAGRISYDTPIALALLGREEGDVVSLSIGPRRRALEILALLPPPAEEVGR